VPNSATSITFTPTVVDKTATIRVNGTLTASGTASIAQPLVVGDNVVKVIVTAQDDITAIVYTVTVTRAMGSMNDVYEPVAVEKPTNTPILNDDGINVHQAVSPNGDGINDFLVIENIVNYPDNKLQIMNRSGQLVFEAKGYDNSTRVFDGHSNKTGSVQLPGTYFYSLDYSVNGIAKHKTGFIMLKY
jgi:gliding motility-associated-like protein